MPQEIVSYCKWLGVRIDEEPEIVIVKEKQSKLAICDADSNVLFDSEQSPLTIIEYIYHNRTGVTKITPVPINLF